MAQRNGNGSVVLPTSVQAALDAAAKANAAVATASASAVETLVEHIREISGQLESSINQLAELDPEAAKQFGRRGRSGPRRSSGTGTRPRNEMGIREAIGALMVDGVQRDTQGVLDGVVAAGYKTTAENFKVIIAQNLSKMKADGELKSPERGQYVAATGLKRVVKAAAAARAEAAAAESK